MDSKPKLSIIPGILTIIFALIMDTLGLMFAFILPPLQTLISIVGFFVLWIFYTIKDIHLGLRAMIGGADIIPGLGALPGLSAMAVSVFVMETLPTVADNIPAEIPQARAIKLAAEAARVLEK